MNNSNSRYNVNNSFKSEDDSKGMSKHSDRAKKGTRTQINAQIRFFQTNLTLKKKELKKAMQYKKYNLPGFASEISKIKKGIAKTEKDLQKFINQKEKLAKDGLI